MRLYFNSFDGKKICNMRFDYSEGFKILFTCVGRRVSLLNSFRNAAAKLNQNCKLYGIDSTSLTAGMRASDVFYVVSPTISDSYIDELCDIVRREKINLVIPTTDHDLLELSQNTDRLEELGCFVLVPSPDVVQTFQDKRQAFKFLTDKGFRTPKTWLPSDIKDRNGVVLPCFLKPWDGYASRGATIVNTREELEFYCNRIPNCIVQEYIKGEEITCDVFVDSAGKVRCVVPRKRIEVRAGEVNKAQINKDQKVIEIVSSLVSVLDVKLCVLTIQLLRTNDNCLYFIEINPRFGGGVPLAIKAGADLPLWLLQSLLNGDSSACFEYKDGLTMLRYDAEIWV